MIDPAEADRVIRQVARKLADRYWWLDTDDLVSEAYFLCDTTDVLEKATSPGAFNRFITEDLTDLHKYEAKRDKKVSHIEAMVEYADLDTDGKIVGRRGRLTDFGWRGGTPQSEWDDEWVEPADDDADEDAAQGERSRLLDRLSSTTKADFLAWAQQELGRKYAKKRDVETFLYGGTVAQAELWAKYVRGKRDLAGTSTPEDRGVRLEEWSARYRWNGGDDNPMLRSLGLGRWDRIDAGDGAHGLVVSADGQTIEVAKTLGHAQR